MGMARGGVVLVVTVLFLGVLTGPALAHGRGSDATNYVSRILNAPEVEGLSWAVLGNDEYLELTNTSDREVTVLGYKDEPYLRVGPDGVFENANSPAAYINDDRFGQVTPPPNAEAEAEPDWRRVSTDARWLWHDHRIHWMAFTLPQVVERDPTAETVVQEWQVPFQVDGETVELSGELLWVPPPSALPWLAGALLLTLPALFGLRTRPESDQRWSGLARPAAVLLGLLALANLTHLADDLFAVDLPGPTVAFAAVQTSLFIGIAAFGALRGWQAREGAFTAIGVGTAALLIGQGLLYAATLTASQTASVWPPAITRAVVALSLVQALPLGIVAVVGTRRLLPPLEDESSPSEVAALGT